MHVVFMESVVAACFHTDDSEREYMVLHPAFLPGEPRERRRIVDPTLSVLQSPKVVVNEYCRILAGRGPPEWHMSLGQFMFTRACLCRLRASCPVLYRNSQL